MDTVELNKAIIRAAENPDAPLSEADMQLFSAATDEFPYFTAPAIVLLRNRQALSPEKTKELQNRVALMVSNPDTLAYAAAGKEWSDFYPRRQAPPTPETTDVIDTFLKTYGNVSPQEEALLEKMIFNPAPDYAEMLAREEQENLPAKEDSEEPDSQEARINAFIRKEHPAAKNETPLPPEPLEPQENKHPIPRPEKQDDSLLSEALARVFIKQGRYERAFDIISSLSLKFPKKSAYFADQLRFFQKLIINQRRLEAEKQP